MVSFSAFAEKVEVEIGSIEDKTTRSIPVTPRVWFDNSIMELSTAFSDGGTTYEITMQDASGIVLCQFVCLSNGVLHKFNVGYLEAGTYQISITTNNRTYIGKIEI